MGCTCTKPSKGDSEPRLVADRSKQYEVKNGTEK